MESPQEQQYIASLNPVERIALTVAQTHIANIFRLKHTVGYKSFLLQKKT